MSERPLISIALCTYNGERFLQAQLDTLVNQDYPNKEIIIVDDASTDGTLEILKFYAETHSFIHLHQNEKNLGFRKNFEKAIGLCSGDLIALSDQDDLWMHDKLSIMEAGIRDHQLIYHDSAFIGENGLSLNKNMSDVVNMYAGDSFKPFLFFNSVSGHACLFKNTLVPLILPLPANIYHDHWIAYIAANLGTIGYIPKTLVKYRQHELAGTNILKIKERKPKDHLAGKNKIISTLAGLQAISDFKYNKEPDFIKEVVKLYHKRLTHLINIKLVSFMLKHRLSLLAISKKSAFSNINFIIKHLWGTRLK